MQWAARQESVVWTWNGTQLKSVKIGTSENLENKGECLISRISHRLYHHAPAVPVY